jgi:myo-inositol 2-dehydrogenase / D-chiro-inositol 1-dehydrogenase
MKNLRDARNIMEIRSDRRKFLLGSAIAAASHLGAAPAEDIRTAFIGAGGRGSELLRQVLIETNVRVTDICDIDPHARDKALSTAVQHKPRSLSEWRRLLDYRDVDAVIIATPCDLHAEMAAACLDAGKYVYCEKPLGITPEQVNLVLQASGRSKAFLQIGQQLRYFVAMREAIRQIHAEDLTGKTFVIKAQRHSTPRHPGSQRSGPAWYENVKRSGDLIVENAIHNLDACNWIANSRPVSAYGHGKKYLPKPIPAGTVMMDGFSVEYVYENDVHLDYSQLYLHPRQLKELPNGMWYVVFAEKGSVFLTHETAMFYEMYGTGEPQDLLSTAVKELTKTLETGGTKEGENAMSEFYACIREKREPFADIRVAATAALTAIMGREAIYKGRSVSWKEMGVTL